VFIGSGDDGGDSGDGGMGYHHIVETVGIEPTQGCNRVVSLALLRR
jgi:hypothetical protein